MKKLIIVFFFFFTLINNIYSQNYSNVACLDVTFNDTLFNNSVYFRKLIESILSNINNPPFLVERNKVSDILEKIQEEKNFYKDFNQKYENQLKLAGVNYLLKGDFSVNNPLTGEISLIVDFIKVSGDDILQKKTLPEIILTKSEFLNNKILTEKIKDVINKSISFSPQLGLVEKNQMNLLEQMQQKINNLEQENMQKKLNEATFSKLKQTPPNVECNLVFIDSIFALQFILKNSVPIVFNFAVEGNVAFNSQDEQKIHPPGLNLLLKELTNFIKFPIIVDATEKPATIIIKVYLRSIYYEELGYNANLKREIVIKYIYNYKTKQLVKTG